MRSRLALYQKATGASRPDRQSPGKLLPLAPSQARAANALNVSSPRPVTQDWATEDCAISLVSIE